MLEINVSNLSEDMFSFIYKAIENAKEFDKKYRTCKDVEVTNKCI